MGLLRPASETAGYLKAGFQGFQGAGKTFTAMELAIQSRKHFGLEGPIAFYDTESGSDYLAAKVRKETGVDMLVAKSRALTDLIATVKECAEADVSILVVDSVTHLWREVCDSYLAQVNAAGEKRLGRNWSKRTFLQFEDWGPIKRKWARWTDVFLNAPLHIIICGRAGYTYDYETSNGKRELLKTGTKMKAEGEFGFEPSLMIEMEQIATPPKKGQPRTTRHRATVIKDRFDELQGKWKDFTPGVTQGNPVWTFLRAHVERLRPSSHTKIDTETQTDFDVDAGGKTDWQREKREREILCESIKNEFLLAYPSQSSSDKVARITAMEEHFGVNSWTAIESMHSGDLKAGLSRLRVAMGREEPPAQEPGNDEVPF